MITTQLFNLANIFVLPFWTLIILLPNWGITRKIMESVIPFVILASVYIYFLTTGVSQESLEALSSPQLADIARAFSDEKVMAVGWTHYLVMDLFVGRWIYWQGQKTGVWTLHSLILCLFAGPIGLLSHIITDWITQRFFPSSNEETSSTPATL